MEATSKKRSPVIKNHPLYKEIEQEVVYQIYDYLDDLWAMTQFVPNPVPNVVEQFKAFRVTATHAVLVMLRWYESRMKDYIYGLKISEGA
jgi:hypothetical protein